MVYLEVHDTGAGMTPDTLRRIFDPFFSTKFSGRGLGLSAVMGIVRSHQGLILASAPSRMGTSFQVLFPSVRGTVTKQEKPSAAGANGGVRERSSWSKTRRGTGSGRAHPSGFRLPQRSPRATDGMPSTSWRAAAAR